MDNCCSAVVFQVLLKVMLTFANVLMQNISNELKMMTTDEDDEDSALFLGQQSNWMQINQSDGMNTAYNGHMSVKTGPWSMNDESRFRI